MDKKLMWMEVHTYSVKERSRLHMSQKYNDNSQGSKIFMHLAGKFGKGSWVHNVY